MSDSSESIIEPSYNEHYASLKQIAETLRLQTEPDIDNLIPLVEKAIRSHEICKQRIEAVKGAFDKLLPAE